MMNPNLIDIAARGDIMIYMLEFIGLLVLAFCMAASPLLVKLFESFFPALDEESHAGTYGLSNARSKDRSDVRDEIRRATSILESHRPNTEHRMPTPRR
jgi:hypothetical protein